MTSVQRKFAATLVTLFIISSTSYADKTTKQTTDDCNEDCIAAMIKRCLADEGVTFVSLSVTKERSEDPSKAKTYIKVVLSANTPAPVDCKIINAIRLCTLIAVRYEPNYYLTISIAPSQEGGQAYDVYSGHTGTARDPDEIRYTMPPCVDALDIKAEGTLSIKYCKVESKVRADAKRLGIRIERLNVKAKKAKGDKLYLQVSGKALAPEVSESQVIAVIKDLVGRYTGTSRINTDKLVVNPRSDKDRRIK